MSQFYLTWTTTLPLTKKKLRFSIKCEILSTSVPFVKKKRLSSTFISMTIVFASLLLYLSIFFFVHYFFVWSGLFSPCSFFFSCKKGRLKKEGKNVHHRFTIFFLSVSQKEKYWSLFCSISEFTVFFSFFFNYTSCKKV